MAKSYKTESLKQIGERIASLPENRDPVEDLLALLYGQYSASRTAEWCAVFRCGIAATAGMNNYIDYVILRDLERIKKGEALFEVALGSIFDMREKIDLSIKEGDVAWLDSVPQSRGTIHSASHLSMLFNETWLGYRERKDVMGEQGE